VDSTRICCASQFTRIGGDAADRITAVSATAIVGESSRMAFERASEWLASDGSNLSNGP
jgi:hypothetical protein